MLGARMMMASNNYIADSVDFDGTNDWMGRGSDLDSISDPTLHFGSFWVRFEGGDASLQAIYENEGKYVKINRTATDKIQIRTKSTSNAVIHLFESSNSYTVSSGWIHVIYQVGDGTTTNKLYINDVSDMAGGDTNDAGTIDLTRDNHSLGAQTDGGIKMDGLLFDFWLPGNFTADPSDVSVRRKFIDAFGKPVYLGENGEFPFGASKAAIFAHINQGESADNFKINAGYGGNFSVTGALSTGANSPTS